MSIGYKNKDKGRYFLVKCFIIGIVWFSVGIIAFLDYFVIDIVRILDWGKYQVLIGVILIVIGAYCISISFKGYEQ